MTGDLTLLDQWMSQRDAEAFRALVQRHGGMVFNTCKRVLRNDAEAEEITQECFEALATARRRPGKHLAAWLHRMASHKAIDRIRSDRRRKAREEAWAETQPTTDQIHWNDVYPAVDEALAKLPEKHRECLLLHFFEGHSHTAMAGLLRCPRTTIISRVDRGVALLRKDLERNGIPVGAVVLVAMLVEHAGASGVPESLAGRLAKLALAGARAGGAAKAVAGVSGVSAGKVWLAGAALVVLVGGGALLTRGSNASEKVTQAESVVTSGPASIPAKEATEAPAEAPAVPAAAPVVPAPPTLRAPENSLDLNGPWQMTIKVRVEGAEDWSEVEDHPVYLRQTGTEVTVSLEDEAIFTCVLEGRRLTSEFHGLLFSGKLNRRSDAVQLNGEGVLGERKGEAIVLLRKLAAAEAIGLACEAHAEALQPIAIALQTFARDHQGGFPPKLMDLFPSYLNDATLLLPNEERTLTYNPSAALLVFGGTNPVSGAYEFDIPGLLDSMNVRYEMDAAPPAEQFAAIEENRRALLGEQFLFRTELLRAEATGTGCVARIVSHLFGLGVEDVTPADVAPPNEEAIRTACANNLKQFGLISKMFANEHRGYTIPGYYTVFPDYLSDPRLCTCPKDPEGTDSYDIFFPGMRETDLAELAREMTGQELSQREAEALVPLMADRQPHADGGRNVLFVDGHVTRLSPRDWASKVAPYLAY